jgi:hypothetical protein
VFTSFLASARKATRTGITLVVVIGLAVGFALLVRSLVSAPTSGATACTHKAGEGRPGHKLAKRNSNKLALVQTPVPVAFSHDRGVQDTDVVIAALKSVPAGVTAEQIRIDIAQRLRRTPGEGTTTVPAVPLLFSEVRIGGTRDRLSFRVCVDGTDREAGSYAGMLTVSGPRGLGRVDVPLAMSIKDERLFWFGVAAAIMLTLLFLIYKESRVPDKLSWEDWRRDHPRSGRWRYVFGERARFGIDWFVLELVVPIALAFGAMYAIYAKTPAWGADTLTGIFALVGTAFGAAGVRSLIASRRA